MTPYTPWHLLMNLREYVKALPRGKRSEFREELAKRHSRSVSLVRKWEHWPHPESWSVEQIKAHCRRHPAELQALKITEELTENHVTRFDLRPELWSD
jgi:hypothetical protein